MSEKAVDGQVVRIPSGRRLGIRVLALCVALAGIPGCGDRSDEEPRTAPPPPVERTVPDSLGADSTAGEARRPVAEIRAPGALCPGGVLDPCSRDVEALNIERVPGRVLEGDSVLSVRTGAGWVRFADTDGSGAKGARYLFAGQFPDRRFAVVERRGYLGTDYVLVDWTSGDTTVVRGPPLVAAADRRFAAAQRDREGIGVEDVIEIWSYAGARPERLWSCVSRYGYGPDDLRWEGGELNFVWIDRNDDYVMATVQRDPETGEWSAHPPPPGGSDRCGSVSS